MQPLSSNVSILPAHAQSEASYQARASRSRRLLKGALQLALTAAAVVLAGVFLFPLSAHAGLGAAPVVLKL